ncbi:helix-turn-helix domain-containing protein [Limnobacter sp.]
MLKSGDVPIATIAEQFGISRSTIYRNAGHSV